jgi:CPA2 family monovalent cation:H+ antiporter-2
VARQLNPDIRIVVRTRYVAAIEELERHGADQVVPEEFETSLEIFARVLRLYGVPTSTIRHEVDTARGEHYGMLRGLSIPGLKFDVLRHLGVQVAIETFEVEEGSRAVGESPVTLALRRETGSTVIAAVRDGQTYHDPDPDFRFLAGDTIVLVGTGEALAKAANMFRRNAEQDRRKGGLRMSGRFRPSGSVTFQLDDSDAEGESRESK